MDTITQEQINEHMEKWINAVEEKKEEFPCNFEVIWPWAYSRKADAKKILNKLDQNLFLVSANANTATTVLAHTGGKPRETILLTLYGAKEFLVGAQTANGKLVRKYFIECEEKWSKLKTHVESGRIALHDNITGETIDRSQDGSNLLANPQYVKYRFDCAVAFLNKNSLIRQKFPDLGVSFFIKINAYISEVVLGEKPRKFLLSHGMIEKKVRNSKDGTETYPAHPNGRDVMTAAQLAVVFGIETMMTKLAHISTTQEEFQQRVEAKLAIMKQVYEEMHGDYVDPSTRLEAVKKQHAKNLAIEDQPERANYMIE
jgi:phage anti-repressor protein